MPALILAAIRGTTIAAVVVVALIVLILVVLGLALARRRPKVEVHELSDADATRYLEELEEVEKHFVDNPQQAAARARGLTEEVMRRMGFPDRIDAEQKARDLARHDGVSAKAVREADSDLRNHSDDTEKLRHAVQLYRDAVRRLLKADA